MTSRALAARAALLGMLIAAGAVGASTAPHPATGHRSTRAAGSSRTSAAAGTACEQVAGNLIANCAFASGFQGWKPQAATSFEFEKATGNRAPGALEMVNEPASEAGAGTCAAVHGPGTYELAGYLRRLQGTGECLAFLEEHTSADCSGGATHFHEMVSTPLVPGAFTRVSGSAPLAADTGSVKAGFACYGEHDDDVSGVLLDDVVLRKSE